MPCDALCRLEYDNGRYVLVVPDEWVDDSDLGPGSMITVSLERFSVGT